MYNQGSRTRNAHRCLLLLFLLCFNACALCKPILSAFYYPGNRRLTQLDLSLNQAALQHLDVLIYAPSIHGLQPLDGTYRMNRISRDNLAFIARYLREHKLSVKLMLSLGYWHPRALRDTIIVPSVRRAFIASIIGMLRAHRYDLKGIDIDWENEYSPAKNEEKRFPLFVKALKQAMQRNGFGHYLLTVDLPSNHVSDFPSPKKWIGYVNWANLMGYDFYGDWLPYAELDSTLGYNTVPYAGKAPHYANISLIGALNQYKARGIPNDKMVVILPLYGTMSRIQHTGGLYRYGLRQPVIGQHKPTYYPYWQIYTYFGIYNQPKNGYTAHQYTFSTPDGANGMSSFWLTKDHMFMSYPDPIAIKQDADYLMKQHYRGLSVWELSDSIKFDDPNSLLGIMAKAEQSSKK